MTSITVGLVSPVLAVAFTFTHMGWRVYKLSPNIVFASLTVFNALRMLLITLPLNLVQLTSFSVSPNQIGRYLLLPQFQKLPSVDVDVNVNVLLLGCNPDTRQTSGCGVSEGQHEPFMSHTSALYHGEDSPSVIVVILSKII